MTTPGRPTILLFDIDGTLVRTAGAGRKALGQAFLALHGRADACDNVTFHGNTDIGIIRQGLRAVSAPDDRAAVEAVISCYLGLLGPMLWRSDACRVYPGVLDTLEALQILPNVAVGLGTGNVEKGARLKLQRLGINDYFAFGGFGCDHEERSVLLRCGVERGAQSVGQPASCCRVVVVGDTPRDVAAAQAIGAESLAVATGPHSVAELQKARPTAVFQDMSAPGFLAALV